MKKSIVFKPYDGMAAKVGDVVYSAHVPEGEKVAASGKVVYTNETQFIVDWYQTDVLTRFARATAGDSLRREVEQFLVNGFVVPAPLEADPGEGQVVYVADPVLPGWYFEIVSADGARRALVIARGLAHATEAAAIAHAKALTGADPYAAPVSLDDAYDNLP